MFEETERNYSLGMAKLRSRLYIIVQALEVSDYAKTQQELEFAQQEMEQFKIYSVKSNLNYYQNVLNGRIKILEMADHFPRVLLAEIADESGVGAGLIEKIIRDMLDRGEIKGRYYNTTETLVIDQQQYHKEIDEIQETFPAVPVTIRNVVIRRQYEYLGGKIRVKVSMENTLTTELLRVIVSLDVPPSFKLLRIEPTGYSRDGASVEITDLLSHEKKSVAWILEPLVCGKEKMGGNVSGVDPANVPFSLPIRPLEIEVRCPLFVQPEEANLPTVQRMIEDLPVNNSRVFLLPENLSPSDAYDVARHAIASRDVRFVGEVSPDDGGSFVKSAWFFGVTKVGQQRFVLSAAVSESDRAIRLTTACDEEAACTGFLAEAGATVRRELVLRGAVDSEEGVRELVCEKCGVTLPRAPVIGMDVKCPECDMIWRVQDFTP
ncbi:MAG TPA: hypothetical protein VKK79_13725 [Candidatus Lokiarchaeia archaeon]|nr:hypothetical protein [Candidatus Lokiarchaeia archaeon]